SFHVSGVQTCALPIWSRGSRLDSRSCSTAAPTPSESAAGQPLVQEVFGGVMSTEDVRNAAGGEPAPLDLAERGMRKGQPISLDRRLFMKFTAFAGCPDPAVLRPALEA